jgi:Mg2+/Co2+ transporter CorB
MSEAQQKSSRVSRLVNLSLAVLWAIMVPVAWMLHWFSSVPFISAASIYANFASHVAAWRSDVNPNQEQLDRIEAKLDKLLSTLEP